jgi:hypothetical protein
VRIDDDRAAVAQGLDSEDQLALLEASKAKEPVARPELGGPELGLLSAYDADVEFVRSVRLSTRSVGDLASFREAASAS